MVKNGLTQYRVKELEQQVSDLDKKVEEILTNHLPHIQSEIESFKSKLNYFTVFNIGSLILALLVTRFLL